MVYLEMGAEKASTKGGGFFHLFDWNRKSRKKLFANGSVSPEGTKQAMKNDDNQPPTHLRLIDDDNIGTSTIKESSDYSCTSSITDGEGNGISAPGVVARLMGLESMPTTGVSEPYSTPLFDPRSLRDRQYQKRGPEFEVNNEFINMHGRTEIYSRKPLDLRPQKMPSSPIERFQIEMLPPRSAKSLPITHFKLLSPIKNPRFMPSKDAAHIMEAAAKILEPGFHTNSNGKVPMVGSSSLSLRVRDSKQCIATPQKISRLTESSKRPAESNALKYLRGKSLNKSWNGSDSDTSCRASPVRDESNSTGAKSKGKSISLAVQAKVNAQKREGLSMSSRALSNKTGRDVFKLGQQLKNQPNSQKDKPQKKVPALKASGVLKQNNQKQNCLMSKSKPPSVPSVSTQGRKVFSGDASSCGNTNSLNKLQGNSKCGNRRKNFQTADLNKEVPLSRTNNLTRKKRLMDGDYHSEKNRVGDNILVSRHEKHIQHNVIIGEQLKQGEHRRKNCMDVVSFTFTSPIVKPMSGSKSSLKMTEKQDMMDDYYTDAHGERSPANVKNKKPASHGLNTISGDALSILLEQKLRELTLGLESSQSNLVNAATEQAASTSEDSLYASENAAVRPIEDEKDYWWGSTKDNLTRISSSGFSSSNKMQGAESIGECSSSRDARKEPEHQHRSPFSILEASFSCESCNSSESYDSTNGTTISTSVQTQGAALNIGKKLTSAEAEVELSDSASSSFMETVDGEYADGSDEINNIETCKLEMEYVKAILSAAKLNPKNFALCYATDVLNSPLFEQLENMKNSSMRSEEEKDDGRLKRKVLFDCVNECLDLKHRWYFATSYQAWSKGMAVIGQGKFAEEIYKEISGWESMGDWMVDEIVDKDMSSHLGRWVDFEADAFETGAEIQNQILDSLIDEVFAEVLV